VLAVCWLVTAKRRSNIEVPSVYKRVIILLRSLFAKTMRLPAYRVHKQLNKHRMTASRLTAKVKAAATGGVRLAGAAERYAFGDVWSAGGCLRLAVEYRLDCSACRPRAPPAEPLLIADYAGAPSSASSASPRAPAASQPLRASASPRHTFLVGSYPYAQSPPLAPGADMFALAASPLLASPLDAADGVAPSLVLSLVPTTAAAAAAASDRDGHDVDDNRMCAAAARSRSPLTRTSHATLCASG
jgi:hypothetical protein